MSTNINHLIENIGIFVFDLTDLVNIMNLNEEDQLKYNNLLELFTLKLVKAFGIADDANFIYTNILQMNQLTDVYFNLYDAYNTIYKDSNKLYKLTTPDFNAREIYKYFEDLEKTFPGQRIAVFRDLLGSISNSGNINVVLSFQPKIATIAGVLAQLTIKQFSHYVEADDVYHINNQDKITVYQGLKNKYKQDILVITTSNEIEDLCKNNGFNCFKIKIDQDIFDLSRAIYDRKKKPYLPKRCQYCRKFFSYKNHSTHEGLCKENNEEELKKQIGEEATSTVYLR